MVTGAELSHKNALAPEPTAATELVSTDTHGEARTDLIRRAGSNRININSQARSSNGDLVESGSHSKKSTAVPEGTGTALSHPESNRPTVSVETVLDLVQVELAPEIAAIEEELRQSDQPRENLLPRMGRREIRHRRFRSAAAANLLWIRSPNIDERTRIAGVYQIAKALAPLNLDEIGFEGDDANVRFIASWRSESAPDEKLIKLALILAIKLGEEDKHPDFSSNALAYAAWLNCVLGKLEHAAENFARRSFVSTVRHDKAESVRWAFNLFEKTGRRDRASTYATEVKNSVMGSDGQIVAFLDRRSAKEGFRNQILSTQQHSEIISSIMSALEDHGLEIFTAYEIAFKVLEEEHAEDVLYSVTSWVATNGALAPDLRAKATFDFISLARHNRSSHPAESRIEEGIGLLRKSLSIDISSSWRVSLGLTLAELYEEQRIYSDADDAREALLTGLPVTDVRRIGIREIQMRSYLQRGRSDDAKLVYEAVRNEWTDYQLPRDIAQQIEGAIK